MVGPYRIAFPARWFVRPYGTETATLSAPRAPSASADFTLGYCRSVPAGRTARVESTSHKLAFLAFLAGPRSFR